MEYFGFFAFVFGIICMGKFQEIERLKKKVRKLEKRVNCQDEEDVRRDSMSRLIEELVGRRCMLVRDDSMNLKGVVLAVDEDWVKIEIEKAAKKDAEKEVQLVRIESIEEVKDISEEVKR